MSFLLISLYAKLCVAYTVHIQCIEKIYAVHMRCIKKKYAVHKKMLCKIYAVQCKKRKEKYSIEKKSILYYTTYSIISFCRKKFFLIIFLENIFRFFGKSDKKAKVKIKKKFSK